MVGLVVAPTGAVVVGEEPSTVVAEPALSSALDPQAAAIKPVVITSARIRRLVS